MIAIPGAHLQGKAPEPALTLPEIRSVRDVQAMAMRVKAITAVKTGTIQSKNLSISKCIISLCLFWKTQLVYTLRFGLPD